MSSILRINSITSRSGINTLDFTGNGFSYVTDVGFGTTSPRGKLDVQGTFLANGGNAGIGTTLPTSRLDVVGDVQVSGVVTATSFRGDGSNLTGVAATSNIRTNAIVNSGVTTVSAGSASIPSISPSGDPNTGIFFPAADTIAFAEGGVEAARFDSSGRLGIGITSPANLLDLFGTDCKLRVRDIGQTNGLEIYQQNSDGGNRIFAANNNYIAFGTNNLERLRINSSGNLGIGTNNPSEKLHVVGDGIFGSGAAGRSQSFADGIHIQPTSTNATVVTGLCIGNDGSGSGTGGAIALGAGNATASTAAFVEGFFDGTGTAFTVKTSSSFGVSAATERLKIDSSGNVTPGANATQDLGSSSLRWANIFSADLQLSNEGSQNDIDGTWGNYTIQEGENDLFLINRRNGKKYKFVLQEVN